MSAAREEWLKGYEAAMLRVKECVDFHNKLPNLPAWEVLGQVEALIEDWRFDLEEMQ